MIVMKFGGTSVEDAAALRNVCDIVIARRQLAPLVVVSACAGVTNALIAIARLAADGNAREAAASVDVLRKRHFGIADGLVNGHHEEVYDVLDAYIQELKQLVSGIAILGELTPRILDQCTSYGERCSSLLLYHALKERQVPVSLRDARDAMKTSDEFTKAAPLFDRIDATAKEVFLPALRVGIVVTQGFIGSTLDGRTTTIGRGGSDYSAAVFGAALNADEIQIWTDVDGILTADPSILPDAHRIKEMTFSEAAELAYFGAKVLHPSTILPAVEKNIPVRVLNSRRSENEGTLITQQSSTSDCIVKSIAYKEGITVVTIQSTRMLMGHGFLARVFQIFAQHKKSVDVVATSEVGVSLTVDESAQLDRIVEELRVFADVRVEGGKAVLCVVGENMKYTKGIAGRVFNALGRAGVNIELISHGGSEINLTFVISEPHIAAAVKSLHDELFQDIARYDHVFA